MPVQKTESNLPGGLNSENIKGFGDAVNDSATNPTLAFISFLGSPIRLTSDAPYWNKYIVFVDTTKVANSQGLVYQWTIEFLDASNTIIAQTAPITLSTQIGVLDFFSNAYYSNSLVHGSSSCRVSVQINAFTLSLTHSIQTTLQSTHDFINSQIFGSNGYNLNLASTLGNLAITATMANLYRDYLLQSTKATYGDTLKIPVNLVAAISYLNVYQHGRNENETLERNLNNPPADWGSDVGNLAALGPCPLKPHFAAMYIPKNGQSGAAYLNFQSLDQIQGGVPEQSLFNQFTALPESDRIAIYNLLRFPKSNFRQCAFILNKLKNRNAAWAAFEKSDLMDQAVCLKTIVSELTLGPHQNLPDYTLLGEKTFQICRSPYILKIIEPVIYQQIKIKILDIRSGRSIKDARVKQIILEAVDSNNQTHTITQAFNYDWNSIAESAIKAVNGLVKETQRALWRLGHYDANVTEAVADGSWDMASTNAYNDFWQEHLLDNSYVHTGTGAPSGDKLRYIIDEYNEHGYSNDAGVLNIRIPLALLAEKQVRIELGFFEFPVLLEKRAQDTADSHVLCRRLNPFGTVSEAETGFVVRWEGQDTQGNVIQSSDWNRNKNWDDTIVTSDKCHFGWQVEDVQNLPALNNTDFLRVCLNIQIKDDFQPFTALNPALLSTFFDAEQYSYHFVMFGMQWCQPVWEPLPESAMFWIDGPVHPTNNTPLGLFTIINQDERTLPAMCTMYDASANKSGQGRDYGANVFYHGQTGSNGPVNDTAHFTPTELLQIFKLMDFGPSREYAPRSRGHHGIDYHAVNHQSPVFAAYGSKVIFNSRMTGYGRIIRLKIKNSKNIFSMAHLSEQHNLNVVLDEVVMAGKYLARAGRTDSITDPNSYYVDGPTHLHLEIAQNDNPSRRISDPKLIVMRVDSDHDVDGNRNLFLNNYSFRLFPCDCHGGESIDSTHHTPASSCAIRIDTLGTDNFVPSVCWASRNLHCPYLHPSNFDTLPVTDQDRLNNFRVQSQLTYLFEDDSNQAGMLYLDPNGIDGNWGTAAQNAIRRFRWKHRVQIYLPQDIPASEQATTNSSPVEGDETWSHLNLLAPYPRTDLNRVDK